MPPDIPFNITDSLESGASFVCTLVGSLRPSPTLCISVAGVVALLVLMSWIGPNVEANEPPLLKPTIPLVGHIIDMVRLQKHFHTSLRKSAKIPVATLPLLNRKMYIVWDTSLVQSVFRNKDLSMVPFAREFATNELGLEGNMRRIMEETDLVAQAFPLIHTAMNAQHLRKMNLSALRYIADQFNTSFNGGEWLVIPNMYLWIREVMFMATCEALYGPGNIFRARDDLQEDFWTFESSLFLLLMNALPQLTAPAALKARGRLQAALSKYYGADKDKSEGTSEVVKVRANLWRQHGVSSADIGLAELVLLPVAASNTIPTLFWFLVHIFCTSGLLERIREEVERVIEHKGTEVVVDVSRFEDECPLLISCYRETLRLSSHSVSVRRVEEDTTITDADGVSYTLKKGCDVQLSATVSHFLADVWGDSARHFDPERFLATGPLGSKTQEKAKKIAYHPFGGGKHLCPGRNFALVENLGYAATLVVGFETQPIAGESAPWTPPEMVLGSQAGGASKPAGNGEGFGVRIRRRAGWEKVRVAFKC